MITIAAGLKGFEEKKSSNEERARPRVLLRRSRTSCCGKNHVRWMRWGGVRAGRRTVEYVLPVSSDGSGEVKGVVRLKHTLSV